MFQVWMHEPHAPITHHYKIAEGLSRDTALEITKLAREVTRQMYASSPVGCGPIFTKFYTRWSGEFTHYVYYAYKGDKRMYGVYYGTDDADFACSTLKKTSAKYDVTYEIELINLDENYARQHTLYEMPREFLPYVQKIINRT